MARGQIVPSLRVVAKIATGCVACLAHIFDMGRGTRLAIDNFGHNASHEVMVNRPDDFTAAHSPTTRQVHEVEFVPLWHCLRCALCATATSGCS